MTDLYIVPAFAGPNYGTKENPFECATSEAFDRLMRFHTPLDLLAVHLNDGVFQTQGTREWDERPDLGFKIGKRWTFDSETGATLAWDSDAVPDELIDSVPIHLLCSAEAQGSTPEEIWGNLPRGQAVRKLKIDLQFSRAVSRWKAKGQHLSIGAVLLSGHQAAVEGLDVTNYGSLGYEAFPLVITGGIGAPARNLIAQLDPAKFILDNNLSDVETSHITDCTIQGYSTDSNDQVTVSMIVGNMGERTPGQWVQHKRAFCYQLRNKTYATGKNLVQAHTIYQCLRGRIAGNHSFGAMVLAYGDFFSTKGLEVLDNIADGADYIARFLLSPSGPGTEQFSHEDYLIARNQSATGIIDLNTLGPSTDKRFIRTMRIENNTCPGFSSEGATDVTRSGNSFDAPARKGCNPFTRFRK